MNIRVRKSTVKGKNLTKNKEGNMRRHEQTNNDVMDDANKISEHFLSVFQKTTKFHFSCKCKHGTDDARLRAFDHIIHHVVFGYFTTVSCIFFMKNPDSISNFVNSSGNFRVLPHCLNHMIEILKRALYTTVDGIYFAIENYFSNLYKAIKPDEIVPRGLQARKKSIFSALNIENEEYSHAYRFIQLIRNSNHNNGIHKEHDEKVTVKGKDILFKKDKPIEIESIQNIPDAISLVVDSFWDIASNKVIKNLEFIPDSLTEASKNAE